MLCARCGAVNADKAIVCKNCSSLLGVTTQSTNKPFNQPFSGGPWDLGRLSAEQQAAFLKNPQLPLAQENESEQSWLEPVAHSPFSNIPLPQPSQPMPTLIQPAGEIKSFAPGKQFASFKPLPSTPSEKDIADYPTNVHIAVPERLPDQSRKASQDLPLNTMLSGPSGQLLAGHLADESSVDAFPQPPVSGSLEPASGRYSRAWSDKEPANPVWASSSSQPLVPPYPVPMSDPLAKADFPTMTQAPDEAYRDAAALWSQVADSSSRNQFLPESQPLSNLAAGPEAVWGQDEGFAAQPEFPSAAQAFSAAAAAAPESYWGGPVSISQEPFAPSLQSHLPAGPEAAWGAPSEDFIPANQAAQPSQATPVASPWEVAGNAAPPVARMDTFAPANQVAPVQPAPAAPLWEHEDTYVAPPQSQSLNTNNPVPVGQFAPTGPQAAVPWEHEDTYAPPLSSQPLAPRKSSELRNMPQSQPLGQPLAPRKSSELRNMPQAPLTASAPLYPTHSSLIRPLPIWATVLAFVGSAAILAALTFFNPDWATGAMIGAGLAIIGALLLLVAAGVRIALGLLLATNPHRRAQVISLLLALLLLAVFSGVTLSQQTSLHAMQARYLEDHHNWSSAISEYQAAGETGAFSVNPARVYNEWGEDLSGQKHYAQAVDKFNAVLNHYSQVSAQVNLARTNLLATYQAWGEYDSQNQHYADATSHYDTMLTLTYCDATCQTRIKALDATTYYNLSEQQLNAKQYVLSVNAFGVLTTRFATTPEATKAHSDYAKALWGLSQQQLTTTCTDAVKTYQQLSQQFADTPEGSNAAKALQQPVPVKGHFTTTIPGAPARPTAVLVQGLTVDIQAYQFPGLLAGAPTTTINSDGTFSFAPVPPGTYELVWSGDGKLHYYYDHNAQQVSYTANIGPVCAYDFGDINETIPTPN